MTTRAQKSKKNVALKAAIFDRFASQRAAAWKAGIGEVRLSQIVHGAAPTDDERRELARVLRRTQAELFPVAAEVTA